MVGIIWFVVVMYIVIRCINSAKKNAQVKPNVPRQPVPKKQKNNAQTDRTAAEPTGLWSGTVLQTQQAGRASQAGYTQQAGRTSQAGYTQQAGRASQPRRTQQTGRAQQRFAAKPAQENSILQKAKANASQQFDEDVLETRGSAELGRVPRGDEIVKDQAKARHIHSEHDGTHGAELSNQLGVDDFDTYHLMDEVNDLIVKGYSGDLEFERDFLSEATSMLNRMYG